VNVLVLGGSVFLGRAIVTEAQALGHDVTVFNRGRSGATPDGAEQVTGDRTSRDDLAQLAGRHFDLVVDTSGYVPVDVGLSSEVLEPACDFYAFVSTINAWPGFPGDADYRTGGVHDGDPDATRDDVPADLDEAGPYGWLKVGCERAASRVFGPERTSILRAGLLVGPDDGAVGRLPWWIDRVARGGEVLVPGCPSDPVALIDARDFARFALSGVAGTFDVPGPSDRDTRADLMAACRAATGSGANFVHVDGEWLAGQGVAFWSEVPLWIPESIGPSTFRHQSGEAVAAGLTWRPLVETVADTWAWQQAVPGGWQATGGAPGLAADREAELLTAWWKRSQPGGSTAGT
jgi:2'-hydroxyisoflavone reductase